MGRQGLEIGAIAETLARDDPQNTFFLELFFQTCRKEVSDAVSEMAHTFYVFPEQLSASFRLWTFS